MLLIDQLGECRLRGVVPLPGVRFAPDILRGGDDFEILPVELFVDLLPTWQIQPAPSPGGPGGHQHFLPAEVGEVHDPALAIGDGEIWRDA